MSLILGVVVTGLGLYVTNLGRRCHRSGGCMSYVSRFKILIKWGGAQAAYAAKNA